MSQIKEGTYDAKVIGSFLGESKEKKTPYVGLKFQYEQGADGIKTIEWVGYLSPGNHEVKDRNIETVVKCGFLGRSLADLAGEFNFADVKNIQIVIEHEEYINTAGESKLRPRVKWVNVGSGFYEKFDKTEAVQKIGGRFDGDLMRFRRTTTNPMSQQPSGESKALNQGNGQLLTTNDVPF